MITSTITSKGQITIPKKIRDILQKFLPQMRIFEKTHYEKSQNGIYQSITAGIAYDHSNTQQRYGVLSAKLQKCF